MIKEYVFESQEKASHAAAARIEAQIREALAAADKTTVVVSGGSTPGQCFDRLSECDLEWERVRVALSDERWVPKDHEASNERMVRVRLAKNKAAGVNVLGIYQSDMTVEERCDSLQSELEGSRFACSLVGLGKDGHFASLFPDSAALPAGLNPDTQHFYIPTQTEASQYGRVSLTLAALLRSDDILLLCFGDAKRQVLRDAAADAARYPIGSLLQQSTVPVSLYWAP